MEQALKQLVVVSLSNSALKQLANFEARCSLKTNDADKRHVDLRALYYICSSGRLKERIANMGKN